MVFQYLNAHFPNAVGAGTRILKFQETRNPYIIKDLDHNYLFGIDKFTIRKAIIPIYKDNHEVKIKIQQKAGSETEYIEAVDFTPYIDEDKFLYSYRSYMMALNDTLQTLATSATISEANTPAFTLEGTNKLKLTFTSDFKNNYKIFFDNALFTDLSSFPYVEPLQPNNNYYRLDIDGAGGTEIRMMEGLSISPIQKIILLSPGLPINFEYQATTQVEGEGIITEPIITDFTYTDPGDGQMVNDISFISGAQYRWHSLLQARNFKNILFEFKYNTTDNELYPLRVSERGSCDIKCLFKNEDF